MSLLHVENEKTQRLAIQVFERHFQKDPILGTEYDDRRKRLMFQDIQYNLAYLDIAIKYNDDKIMAEYAVWIYQLLCVIWRMPYWRRKRNPGSPRVQTGSKTASTWRSTKNTWT